VKIEIKYVEGRQVYSCPSCGYEQAGEFPILRTFRNAFGRRETTYKCPKCEMRLSGW